MTRCEWRFVQLLTLLFATGAACTGNGSSGMEGNESNAATSSASVDVGESVDMQPTVDSRTASSSGDISSLDASVVVGDDSFSDSTELADGKIVEVDTTQPPDVILGTETITLTDANASDSGTVTDAGGIDSGSIFDGALCGLDGFSAVVVDNAAQLGSTVLISQQPDMSWAPSTIYQWNDLLAAMAVVCSTGIGGFTFWVGSDGLSDNERSVRALVNLAAFLAQSMKETIRYDACDENNWDDTNGYLLSNACGQLNQNYADYDCDMACPQDVSMKITAVTNARWYGAPGPLFCAPDAELISAGLSTDGSTGRWDYNANCWPYPATEPTFVTPTIDARLRPDCQVYAGQEGGKYVFDGTGGSVAGCCWWGRGVIQTTGRCNFGILNHYLGSSHLDTNVYPVPGPAPYPDVDFCKNPEIVCSSNDHPELKWIAGLFYWMASVQTYQAGGWSYTEELDSFIASGLSGDAFIDSVSGIVNRGCHDAPCETGPVDGLDERRANFHKVLQEFGLE